MNKYKIVSSLIGVFRLISYPVFIFQLAATVGNFALGKSYSTAYSAIGVISTVRWNDFLFFAVLPFLIVMLVYPAKSDENKYFGPIPVKQTIINLVIAIFVFVLAWNSPYIILRLAVGGH